MTIFVGELSAATKGTGDKNNSYRPDLNGIQMNWQDVTGMPNETYPAEPDAINVLFSCDDVALDELIGNNDYYIHWYEEISEDGT